MPLTNKGLVEKRKFDEEYGSKRGDAIFFSYMNKYPDRTKSWHKTRDSNGGKKR